jgi:hypothetical protein
MNHCIETAVDMLVHLATRACVLPSLQARTAAHASRRAAVLTHECCERRALSFFLGVTAYDYFPCQHQIFYHLKGGKSFWYDPVFKVETMNGEVVWRRRHYRVKRDKV